MARGDVAAAERWGLPLGLGAMVAVYALTLALAYGWFRWCCRPGLDAGEAVVRASIEGRP